MGGRRVAALESALHLSVHVGEHGRLFAGGFEVVGDLSDAELLGLYLDDRAGFVGQHALVQTLQRPGLLGELLLDVVEPAGAGSARRTSGSVVRPVFCRGPR